MSLIVKGEPDIGDTSSLSIYLNAEDEESPMLEFVKGEDDVLIQIPLTAEQLDVFSHTMIDVV